MTVQTCVPYLGLDYFGINFNASGSKLHSNGRYMFKIELVACVKHDRRSDLPTPESPTSTTRAGGGREGGERKGEMEGEEVGRGRK